MGRRDRLLHIALWSAVCAAAVVAWRWQARGFPVLHPRFVVNEVAPAALLVAGVAALVRRDRRESHAAVAALALSFGAAALVLFGRAGAVAAATAIATGLPFAVAARPASKLKLVTALLFAAVGAGAAWGLRAPDPSTKPLGTAPETDEAVAGEVEDVPCGRLLLSVDPLLQFEQASSGRFWSPFEPDDVRGAIAPATLQVEVESGGMLIDSARTLTAPVFAHLDRYAMIRVWRAKRLRVRIAPGTPAVDVLPSDYPSGRPARFLAWSGEQLTAWEATSAEKGPFHALAQAPLRRGEPVTLELLDGDEPQCRVSLLDFTAQASTELSPTAGWGIPQNAIELLASDTAPVQWILVTLASTSVGRGFDTVGHAQGTYRNRMRIRH